MPNFLSVPHHINAEPADLAGNHGIGRYVFLPGSDGRAKLIAESFDDVTVKEHPRGHHLYLGTLEDNGVKIDVAAISSGMGCPSIEIVLHELYHLGAKRFLRVGTAGSLQKNQIKIGDIINTQASVRDESTTVDYAPISVPAIASVEMTDAIHHAAKKCGLADRMHTGIVHCKSSFYAREFYAGPSAEDNKHYNQLLIDIGVLASEMETAALFIQTQLYRHQLRQFGGGPEHKVFSGAILGIGAIPPEIFMTSDEEHILTADIIRLAVETIKTLAATERVLMR
jgi:uridine phosphorylase